MQQLDLNSPKSNNVVSHTFSPYIQIFLLKTAHSCSHVSTVGDTLKVEIQSIFLTLETACYNKNLTSRSIGALLQQLVSKVKNEL